jgi:hypothetical protein
MPYEKLADRLIREAMKEGVFDNLPNAGRPLDLEDYFKVPEELRAAYGLLKSANVVPEAVEVLREIDRLEQSLAAETDAGVRDELRSQIEKHRLRFELLKEQQRR